MNNCWILKSIYEPCNFYACFRIQTNGAYRPCRRKVTHGKVEAVTSVVVTELDFSSLTENGGNGCARYELINLAGPATTRSQQT